MQISKNKQRVVSTVEKMAFQREKFLGKNKYYYQQLLAFFRYNIPVGSRVLEVGCGLGNVLHQLKPAYGVGVDISGKMVELASKKYPELHFQQMDAEKMVIEGEPKFDFIIISDTLGYLEDIQQVFAQLGKYATSQTRFIITYHNFLWQPLLDLAEFFGLKMKQERLNWLNSGDIANLLNLENYEIIKSGKKMLLPKYVPFFAWLLNTYVANLPLINKLCLVEYVIARKLEKNPAPQELSVSVVIPARNESGNIENALKRIPKMGKHLEIIFVEGNSTDDTWQKIQEIAEKYKNEFDLKITQQDGKGKGDAVRKGFAMATGEVLMILDADLTVPPEDLPKFYDAIASGKGEYINGCRLVYPMEQEAMRLLNIFGNKFFSVMFSFLLGQRLKDTLCGTKVLSRENYQKLIANRSYFGDFDPFGDFDLIFGSAKLNLKIVEVPIRYKSREYGDTNISRFKHGLILLRMVIFAMNKIKFI